MLALSIISPESWRYDASVGSGACHSTHQGAYAREAIQDVDRYSADILRCWCFYCCSGLLVYWFIIGCAVPSLYAHNRGTCRGSRSLGCVSPYLVACSGPEQFLGFVLAGIPVYYITRSNNHDVPRILGEHLTEHDSRGCFLMGNSQPSRFS